MERAMKHFSGYGCLPLIFVVSVFCACFQMEMQQGRFNIVWSGLIEDMKEIHIFHGSSFASPNEEEIGEGDAGLEERCVTDSEQLNNLSYNSISDNEYNSLEIPNTIRVLLSNNNDYYIDTFTLSFDDTYYIQCGNNLYVGEAGTSLSQEDVSSLLAQEDEIVVGYLEHQEWNQDRMWNMSLNHDLSKNYQGTIHIYKTNDSKFYLVNELPLETYLYYVLPSEMPSDFGLEALKAQAVCARTYAILQILDKRMEQYHADVDDSQRFQVYHALDPTEEVIRAVDETRGQYLCYEGYPIEAFYYSCSCGHSTTPSIWKNSASRDYSYYEYQNYGTLEEEIPWFRWEYEADKLNLEQLKENLLHMVKDNPDYIMIWKNDSSNDLIIDTDEMEHIIEDITQIKDMEIRDRLQGNVADGLVIIVGEYSIYIKSEYYIRNVLAADDYLLIRQDGSKLEHLTMVPSGFFDMTLVKEGGIVTGFVLEGGGFGHGVGMSQYGAKILASGGYTYEQILTYYYKNVTIEELKTE